MKIVELLIDEFDEESGVEYLSLVKNPATHQTWQVFEDESECGGECQISKHLNESGEDIMYLLDNSIGFTIETLSEKDITLNKEGFYTITSQPNTVQAGDGINNTIVRYYYAVDTGLGATLIKSSRKLCRQLVRADLVYGEKDLTQLSMELTADAQSRKLVPRTQGTDVNLKIYKAGKYCRHIFKKIVFTLPEGTSVEEFVAKVPKRSKTAINSRISGNGVRPTIENQIGRGGISEWKIYMSEDYEGPISLVEGLVVYNTIDALFKGEPECMAITEIEFDGMKGFIGVVPSHDYFENDVKILNSVMRESFDSYNDYPKQAQLNACRAVAYAEEYGWGDCGTDVGKHRAHQLCNGDNISEETIARMASFARHRQHKDVKYNEGCGGLMYDAWGGDEGIEWAQRKLEQIRNEMREEFSCVQMLIDQGYGETEARQKCYEIKNPDTTNYPDNVLPLSNDFLEDNPCQEGYIAYGTKIKDGREVPNCIPIESRAELEEYEDRDREMIDGVINLIIQVDDMEERKKIAEEAIKTFTEEGVRFDITDFLMRLGLQGQMTFADDLKYEVTSVVMEPNKYIARRDDFGNVYYVFFSEDTVKKMSQKFFRQDRHKSFNYEHSGLRLNGGYVVESWLVMDPENDKSKNMGFSVNKGTWMVTLKWDDKKQFEEYVVNGKTMGISLEGNFLSQPVKMSLDSPEEIKTISEQEAKFFVEEIINILRNAK